MKRAAYKYIYAILLDVIKGNPVDKNRLARGMWLIENIIGQVAGGDEHCAFGLYGPYGPADDAWKREHA